MRVAVVAMLLGAGLVLAVPATAGVLSRTDTGAGVSFRLDGRVLTVGIVPQPDSSPPDARRKLFGRHMRAACGVSLTRPAGAVHRTRRWPEGRLHLTYRFPRDLSGSARFCLLEGRDGGDVAVVRFPRGG
jgi:hypothetical protein